MKKLRQFFPAIAAFLLMMAMGACSSGLGFFVAPVCEELQIGRGSFGLYYSLMTAAGAVSTPVLGQYIRRRGVKKLIFFNALWFGGGLLLFSVSNALWMFYLAGAAMGLVGMTCAYLCTNVIVQQSFSQAQAASLLGVIMAGSGVGGMIFSLILPGIIEQFGWRLGYRFLAAVWMLLVLFAMLLVKNQSSAEKTTHNSIQTEGMSQEEALRSPKFRLMVVVMLFFSVGSGLQQQLPSLLNDMDFSSAQVGVMMSFMTAGLAVGKIVQGVIYSRIGMRKGGTIMTLVFCAGLWMLTVKALIYPALICIAFGLGILSTLLPTAARIIFGIRDYASIWGLLTIASSVGSFSASPMWGIVYDAFGSYRPALMAVPLLLLTALLCLRKALGKGRR